MRKLNDVLIATLEPLIKKKHGPEFAKIFTYWQMLAGPELSSICAPIKIDKQDKILTVSVITRASGTILHFSQEYIIIRINNLMERNNMKLRIQKVTPIVIS